MERFFCLLSFSQTARRQSTLWGIRSLTHWKLATRTVLSLRVRLLLEARLGIIIHPIADIIGLKRWRLHGVVVLVVCRCQRFGSGLMSHLVQNYLNVTTEWASWGTRRSGLLSHPLLLRGRLQLLKLRGLLLLDWVHGGVLWKSSLESSV